MNDRGSHLSTQLHSRHILQRVASFSLSVIVLLSAFSIAPHSGGQ
jgi:hypothetical protein